MNSTLENVATAEKEETKVTVTMSELQAMIAKQVAEIVAQRSGHTENTMSAETFREEIKPDKKMMYKYCDEDKIDALVNIAEKYDSKKYREKDWNNRAWKSVHALGDNGKGKAVEMKGRLGRITCSWCNRGKKLLVAFSGKPTFSFKEKLENKGFKMDINGVFSISNEKFNTKTFVDLLPKYATDVFEIASVSKTLKTSKKAK